MKTNLIPSNKVVTLKFIRAFGDADAGRMCATTRLKVQDCDPQEFVGLADSTGHPQISTMHFYG